MVYWPGLPSIVFGSMSFIAGAITFLAPDSADSSLPDTVRQAEALGTKIKGNDNIAMTHEIRNIEKQNGVKDPKLGIENPAMTQDNEGRMKNSWQSKNKQCIQKKIKENKSILKTIINIINFKLINF